MAAKDKLVELCEAIVPIKTEDEELIDCGNAVEYFDGRPSALREANARDTVQEELTLILALGNAVSGPVQNVNDLELDALVQPNEEDSPIVALLRETVAKIRNAAMRQQHRREQQGNSQEDKRRVHGAGPPATAHALLLPVSGVKQPHCSQQSAR